MNIYIVFEYVHSILIYTYIHRVYLYYLLLYPGLYVPYYMKKKKKKEEEDGLGHCLFWA